MASAQAADVLVSHQLIEDILHSHREHANGDARGWDGYRGHVYRVFNLARAFAPAVEQREDRLAVAAAFHDIDVFGSLNYLGPSIHTMSAWLRRTGRDSWIEELAVIVAEHHRLIRYRGPHAELAEAFRRADLVDVSQGGIRFGLSREQVRLVRTSFDVGCYFTRTIPAAVLRQLRDHPLDPLPILRARRALRESG